MDSNLISLFLNSTNNIFERTFLTKKLSFQNVYLLGAAATDDHNFSEEPYHDSNVS